MVSGEIGETHDGRTIYTASRQIRLQGVPRSAFADDRGLMHNSLRRQSSALPLTDSEKDMFDRMEFALRSGKPYCSGTLSVTKDQLVVFYGKDMKTAG